MAIGYMLMKGARVSEMQPIRRFATAVYAHFCDD